MAIDINKLNQSYTKEKSTLDKMTSPGGLKDTINQWEEDIHNLKKDYAVKQMDYDYAKTKNDKATMQKTEKEMINIKQQAEALALKLRKAQSFLNQQQKKVDAKIEELSNDPETKKKLDSILYKKYDRKRKAEANKKKELETIKEIVDNHPNVKKWLTGIEGYNKSIKLCNRVINKLSTKTPLTPEETKQLADAQAELPVSQAKLSARKADLVAYFAKNHPEISKDTLEGLHSYGDINRQMQGCDKTIANCTKAMGNLTVSKNLEDFTNSDSSSPNLPAAQKPSWWHPIKRIQYEINARKNKQPISSITQSKNEQKKSLRDELKLSKDEYNAEIVQKYLEGYDKGLHEAAKQNRGNNEGSR